MKNILLMIFLVGIQGQAFAQIREFQTARLMSTAGAGVASILSTEAAILNPASSSFFSDTSFSYQRYQAKLREKNSELRQAANDPFPKRNESQGVFLSDHSDKVKGGVAYLQQHENNYRRERMIFHGASMLGETTSVGVSYNYLMDKQPRTFERRHLVHHQVGVGITKIVSETFVVGLVVQDPTRTTPGEERAIAGVQYNFATKLTLIGDYGIRYTKDASKDNLWRAAVQANLFSDVYARVGRFYDNVTKLRGTGFGVSWMGPRLGLEFAQKMSDQIGNAGYLYKDERLVDTSLSAFIKF